MAEREVEDLVKKDVILDCSATTASIHKWF
jgi:hypothetical protein